MIVAGIPYIRGRNSYSDPDGAKYGIAIHNTSNDASAESEASYATRRTDGISAHFYADSDSVIQSLDTDARAGHAGSSNGNNHAVAVEITGINGWSRAQWLAGVAWPLLGRVLAEVCRRYGIAVRRASVAEMGANPRVRAFYGHDDMRQAWGGTTHTDPGPNFPWDRLFEAVSAALSPTTNGVDDMDTVDRMRLKLLYENWAPTRAEYVAAGGIAADYDTLTAGGSGRNALALRLFELGTGQVKLGDGLSALSAKVDALAAGGVTHEQLVAALIDPAVLAAVRQAAFEGAQRAEGE